MQPYFFPYIGYFQLINTVDKFILYGNVNFIKKGYINRNSILNSDHRSSFPINIPLKNQSSNRLIEEISIDESLQWRKDLTKTISNTYKRAPFFEQVYPIIENILYSSKRSIHEFNCYSIVEIARYIGIKTNISFNEAYFPTIEKDISEGSFQKFDINKKVHRIFLFCEFERASHYINPIGGKELYDKELFNERGIQLDFLKPDLQGYKQFKPELFVPNLSIIDVLMFNSVSNIKILLNQFILV